MGPSLHLESKGQSKQWKHPSSSQPKKAKTVLLAGKIMASVFWNADGILMVEYLQKGQTINGTYYASLLRQLRENIKVRCHGKLSKGVLLPGQCSSSHVCHWYSCHQ